MSRLLPGVRGAAASARVQTLLFVLLGVVALGCSSAPEDPAPQEPVSSSQSEALTTNLTAVDDSYIISTSTGNTTGNSPYIFIGSRGSGSTVFRTLLKFNLGGIPDGATVSSATLTLRAVTPTDMTTNNPTNPLIRVYPVSYSWSEATNKGQAPAGGGQANGEACVGSVGVTWLRRNCGSNTWPTAGGNYGSLIDSTTVTTAINTNFTWDVKSYVQSVVDGTTDNGLILRASAEATANVRLFEANGSSNPPKLTVVYKRGNGDSCTSDSQCTSNACVDVNGQDCATGGGGGCVCCNTGTCSGSCQSCRL